MLDQILNKISTNQRLDEADGVALLQSSDLISLGAAADAVRQQKHPQGVVTYVVDRNINYTNLCTSGCRFCAFYTQEEKQSYLLSHEEIFQKIEDTIAQGGTQILMQGGLHPQLKIDYFENLFRAIKERYKIHLHALSPPEVVHIAQNSGWSLKAVVQRLKDAGLDSIPGGGAEILTDRVRSQLSPHKCTAAEWLQVMEIAHTLGLPTTATMMFGHVEKPKDRIAHLLKIRELQDKTHGFTAFIPWSFQPANTQLDGQETTAFDYLKTLAVSRLMLDNIPNLQVSWVTQGAKIAQVALAFGANDFGSVMMEENVVRAAGVSFRMTEAEIRRTIEDAGYRPVKRDMRYRWLE
jgi:cyclic dehypoxanthinyl futalosine synthase